MQKGNLIVHHPYWILRWSKCPYFKSRVLQRRWTCHVLVNLCVHVLLRVSHTRSHIRNTHSVESKIGGTVKGFLPSLSRRFLILEHFLRLYFYSTPSFVHFTSLFLYSKTKNKSLKVHKENKLSQCKNARHLGAAEQTKDWRINSNVHKTFLSSLQAVHLFGLISSLHTHLNPCWFAQVHTVSPPRKKKKKHMCRCNHNTLATQQGTFQKKNTFFSGGWAFTKPNALICPNVLSSKQSGDLEMRQCSGSSRAEWKHGEFKALEL